MKRALASGLASGIPGRLPAYFAAALFAALAVGLRAALDPTLGIGLTYLLVVPVVMAASWLGGAGPGALGGVLAAGGTLWLYTRHGGDPAQPAVAAQTALLAAAAGAICCCTEHLRRARGRAEANAAASLRTAQQHLRAAFASAPISLFDMDTELRYTRVINPPYGLREADLIGKRAEDVLQPAAAARVTAARRQVLATGTRQRVEITSTLRGCDDPHSYDIVIVPRFDAYGALVGLTNAVVDITEKVAEQARARETEERFRIAQESALDGFMVLRAVRNRTGVIEDFTWDYINPVGAAAMRLARERLLGQRLLMLLPGHRHHLDLFPAYAAVANGGPPRRAEVFYDRDGFRHWYKTVVVQAGDGVAVTFSDISAERAAADRSEQALQAAEAANRAKDDFLANLSHELRTPLNAILGWARLMGMEQDAGAKVKHAAEVIARNARTQADLIDDLLDMNRILSGQVTLELQTVDVAEVVERAIETVAPDAARKSAVLQNTVPRNLLVQADPQRLKQVFWNLLANAVKFTPEGGLVRVGSAVAGDKVCISIEDTGEGIAPDFLPHLFERFRQHDASSTRRHGGLGLGLSIVKSLVELHGGHISASSRGRGFGARFDLELPAGTAASGASGSGGVDVLTHYLSNALSGLRVLVVDDEADARDLVREVLGGHGAAVDVAQDAGEALDLWSTRQYDVLISDLGMPLVDGYELMRRLRGSPAWAPPRHAIALTAFGRAQDRRKAAEAGFDLLMAKPFEPNELVQTITALAMPVPEPAPARPSPAVDPLLQRTGAQRQRPSTP
ncbi:hybrid sensor histidine kinase/response regulator [Caldimonas brevitalea]|uniref:histidine kinase n=1 Tax=Caldimonas brevitalea TaxID=413882 RepID=A0A0G3BUN8_9BURK|nr:ATP-binding protein [Caldimonas brevitalea]AKJ30250.1 two-component sensor histidine kinase [Caldimonas brevitalea]